MTLSADIKRVYASAPSDRRYIETLELWHPLFPRRYFITNDVQAWQFLLSASSSSATPFDPVPFSLTWPTSDGKGQQDAQLQIDNVGREAMDAIEAAAQNPTINITTTIRVYLDIANTPPQNDPPMVLALQSLQIDAGAIVGTATRADVLNRPFPTSLYRVDLFPGLNR
jgi:hypothetical protein